MGIGEILIEQVKQVLPYWAVGILIGSAISVFGKEKLHRLLTVVQGRPGELVAAAALGVLSPLCMYGTVPIAAALAHKGARHDVLAAFMMSSVLINPQLLIYTAALGGGMVAARAVACLLCGVGAGLLVRRYATRSGQAFFDFSGVSEGGAGRDVHPRLLLRYLANVWRNIRATAPWFAVGIALAAAFVYALPHSFFLHLQQQAGSSSGAEVVGMALAGIPFYVCGGGAVPLMAGWMQLGMGAGAIIAFSLTGAGTKITNLSALKMVLGMRRFLCYIAYVTLFAIAAGVCTNLLYQ